MYRHVASTPLSPPQPHRSCFMFGEVVYFYKKELNLFFEGGVWSFTVHVRHYSVVLYIQTIQSVYYKEYIEAIEGKSINWSGI